MEIIKNQTGDFLRNNQIQFAMEFCAWSFCFQDGNKNSLYLQEVLTAYYLIFILCGVDFLNYLAVIWG